MTQVEFDALCVKIGYARAYAQIVGRPDWGLSLELNIPHHMHRCMVQWLAFGESYDEFMTAIVTNDLRGTFLYGDDTNKRRIMDYMLFLHNAAPSDCYGSPENAKGWKASGGLCGQLAELAKEEDDGA